MGHSHSHTHTHPLSTVHFKGTQILQTYIEFTLPRGYMDEYGQLHQQGKMRLATAIDEVTAAQEPNVVNNETYLPFFLLCRVITELGSLSTITPKVIGGLFASDLLYLEELYQRLNSPEPLVVSAVCPRCTNSFHLQVAPFAEMEVT